MAIWNKTKADTTEEDAALIAYADVDDQNSYADSQFRQAAASGIPLHGYRLDFLAYRGTKECASDHAPLCGAIWSCWQASSTWGATCIQRLLAGRGRQRRT
jgi:hypothetical protein